MARVIHGSDGSVITKNGNVTRKNGEWYTESGNSTFGGDGSVSRSSSNLTWQSGGHGSRTVTQSGNTWYASDGKTYRYNSGAGILYCSDGRTWNGLASAQDADRIVRMDY